MKKILIVLVATLLLFSFTSCEKDKSEEVIATYEEFWKTFFIDYQVEEMIDYKVDPSTSTVNCTISASTIKSGDFECALCYILGKDLATDSVIINSAEGTVTGTKNSKGVDLTFDVTITYAFKGETEAKTFTLKGTYKNSNYESFEFKFTIDGAPYNLSYKGSENGKVTEASVNGKDVDVRLINSNAKILGLKMGK